MALKFQQFIVIVFIMTFLSVGPILAFGNDILQSISLTPFISLALIFLVIKKNIHVMDGTSFLMILMILVIQVVVGLVYRNDVKFMIGDFFQLSIFLLMVVFFSEAIGKRLLPYRYIYILLASMVLLDILGRLLSIVMGWGIGYSYTVVGDSLIYRVQDPYHATFLTIVTFALLKLNSFRPVERKWLKIIFIISASFVVFSMSRANWLALVVGICVVSFCYNISLKRIVLVFALVILLANAFGFGRVIEGKINQTYLNVIAPQSTQQAVRLNEVLSIIDDIIVSGNPMVLSLGKGAGATYLDKDHFFSGDTIVKHYTHTTLAQLLLRSGLIGVALFIMAFALLIYKMSKLARMLQINNSLKVILSATAGVMAGFFASSFGGGVVLSFPMVLLLGGMWGVSMARRRMLYPC